MSKRKCRALMLALGAGVSWVALSTAVQAQDAETEVGEVIVTATRRAESIQDVPMSVSAVTGEQLEKFQLQSFDDIQEVTAGLTLERDGDHHPARRDLRPELGLGSVGGHLHQRNSNRSELRIHLDLRRRADRSPAWSAGHATRPSGADGRDHHDDAAS